jgi:hypothetical protein
MFGEKLIFFGETGELSLIFLSFCFISREMNKVEQTNKFY